MNISFIVFVVTHSFSFLDGRKATRRHTHTQEEEEEDCDKTQTQHEQMEEQSQSQLQTWTTIINSIDFEITSVQSHKSSLVSHKHILTVWDSHALYKLYYLYDIYLN